MHWDQVGVDEFLRTHARMRLAPLDGDLSIVGRFVFFAKPDGGEEIEDSFELSISIPDDFPRKHPVVREVGSRIPKTPDFHVNPDGTFCLGSQLRLLEKIHRFPTLSGFAESCDLPYLYAVSYKLVHGGNFVFDDLAHGTPGAIQDYKDIFRLNDTEQVIRTLELIGMKRRIANKQPCPCGCSRRLGICPLNDKVRSFRAMAPRSWFTNHAYQLRTYV